MDAAGSSQNALFTEAAVLYSYGNDGDAVEHEYSGESGLAALEDEWLLSVLKSGHGSSAGSSGHDTPAAMHASTAPLDNLDAEAEEEEDEPVDISNPMAAEQLIQGFQLDLPELSTVLHDQPSAGTERQAKQAKQAGRSRDASPRAAPAPSYKMTDMGLRMSQMVLSTASTDAMLFEAPAADHGDAMVESYGMRRRRNRPGQRGRPKGSTKPATQFGRGSSTHALPPAVATIMGRANMAYVQRRHGEAISLYLEVVQRAPACPEPYYSLGLVYEESGDADRAASYFLLAAHLQSKPEPELWRKAAALLVGLPHRRDQAVYCLNRAARNSLSGGDYDAVMKLLWLRCKLLLELGNYRSAITSFALGLRAVLTGGPDGAASGGIQFFVPVAKLALKMNLAYIAADMFDALFAKHVADGADGAVTWSHVNLLVELREAEEDYRAVVEAMESLGRALVRSEHRRQKAAALTWHTEAEEDGDVGRLERQLPTLLAVKYMIAQLRLKKSVDLECLRELVAEQPSLAVAVADAVLEVDPQWAVDLYAEHVARHGLSSGVGTQLGQAYHRTGRTDAAVETLHAVLQEAPECREARLLLAECYRQMGKFDVALQLMRHAEEAVPKGPEGGASAFISWAGVDEVLQRTLGVPLERGPTPAASCGDSDYSDSEASIGSDTDTDTDSDSEYSEAPRKQPVRALRFGSQRAHRLRAITKQRPVEYSAAQQAHVRALHDHVTRGASADGDVVAAARALVNDYVENQVVFGGGRKAYEWREEQWTEAARHGLTLAQWSRALMGSVRVLLASGSAEIGRVLGRKLLRRRSLLLSAANQEQAGLWRVLLLLLPCDPRHAQDSAGAAQQTVRALRWFLQWRPDAPAMCLLPGALHGLLRGSSHVDAYEAAYHDAVSFRALVRLAQRHAHSAAVHLLLGHQSMRTSSYEEAARAYLQAYVQSAAQLRGFCALCLSVALLQRAFQRTCANPVGRVLLALGFLQEHGRWAGAGEAAAARHNVARWLQAAGWPHLAASAYQQARSAPGDAATHALIRYNQSRLFLMAGAARAARACLQ